MKSATKLKFSDADIDKNIKSFRKIRLMIDFEAYKDMLCDLQRKCTSLLISFAALMRDENIFNFLIQSYF